MNNSLPRHVSLSSEVLFQELKNESVLLDLATEQYIGLDAVGTRIWQLLEETGDTEATLAQMLQEYDVDEETLHRDLVTFIQRLSSSGLIKFKLSE